MDINELITRINELAQKKKIHGLSKEEIAEQAQIRQRYINFIKDQVRSSLEQTKKGN